MNKKYYSLILGFLLIISSALSLSAQSSTPDTTIAIPDAPPLLITQQPDTTLPKVFASCYFPGWKAGIDLKKFFLENAHIPDSMGLVDFSGKVYVKAHVTKEGNIDSMVIVRGFKQPQLQWLNDEAVRLVRLLPEGAFIPEGWNPDREPEWYVLPLDFDR